MLACISNFKIYGVTMYFEKYLKVNINRVNINRVYDTPMAELTIATSYEDYILMRSRMEIFKSNIRDSD